MISDCVNIDISRQGLLPRLSNATVQRWKGSRALSVPAKLILHATKIAWLTLDQCEEYDAIKAEILTPFWLTTRFYYEQFIGSKKRQGENIILLWNRLSELQSCYLESKKLMQVLFAIPIDVRKFVEERTPSSSLDAA